MTWPGYNEATRDADKAEAKRLMADSGRRSIESSSANMLLDQVYGVPMYDETQTTPYRSYLKGMQVPPEDIPANLSFATAWLDKSATAGPCAA